MAPSFPISLANFPALRTNKALLMIDLQNEFCGPGGTLPVSLPEGYVDRALAVAHAFRASGFGEVFWIRSQFDSHRPAADSRIIATENFVMPLPSRPSRNRRQPQQPTPSPAQPTVEDGDEEAFLSVGGPNPEEKRQQVQRLLPGSASAEMSATVVAAVDTSKDIVLAKSHYSAFQSSQLLTRLRTHFVTELYLCGALTNISIHATAVDAARYGLALTLIEDCCGYRSENRQSMAVQSLVQLTGCDLIDSEMLIDSLPDPTLPPPPPRKTYGPESSRKPHKSHRGTDSSSSHSSGNSHSHSHGHGHSHSTKSNTALATGKSSSLPVRTKAPEPDREEKEKEKEKETEKSQKSQSTDEPRQDLTELKPALPTAGVSPEAEPSVSASVQPVEPVSIGTADEAPESIDDSAKKEEPQPEPAPNVSSPNIPKMEPTEAAPTPTEAETTEPTSTAEEPSQIPPMSATEPLCEGDTLVYRNVLPPSLEEDIYDRLCDEVDWLRMAHHGGEVPRLISVQGEIDDDGNMPVYRHPADESPPLESFSPTVLKIKARIEEIVGHPLNHVLIQLYRNGHDYISEHSDKTLDIVPDSYVCNVSLGAERTLLFRTKRERKEEEKKEEKKEKKEEKTEGKTEEKTEEKEEKKEEKKEETEEKTGEKEEKEEEKKEKKQEKKEETEEKEEKKEKKKDTEKKTEEKKDTEEKEEKKEEEKAPPKSEVNSDKLDSKDNLQDVNKHTQRKTCRVQLPHNSLCRMGLQTNMRWLHAIRQDKRMDRDKTTTELAFGGGRISLTFRRIGTFLNGDQTLIWGQGAVAKTRETARAVVNGQGDEAVRMLRAFGAENHSVDFDWQTHYGSGFDVLNMGDAARFFASSDPVVNLSIQLQLAELGLSYAKGSMGETDEGGPAAAAAQTTLAIPVRFTDSDRGNTVVDGILAIMLYLDSLYGPGKRGSLAQVETAYTFTRLQQALRLQDQWRTARRTASSSSSSSSSSLLDILKDELAAWNKLQPGAFIAGGATASVADFAFWPVLHQLAKTQETGDDFAAELQRRKLYHLAQYYTNFQARENVQRVCKSKG